jgi:hypothetical protein
VGRTLPEAALVAAPERTSSFFDEPEGALVLTCGAFVFGTVGRFETGLI